MGTILTTNCPSLFRGALLSVTFCFQAVFGFFFLYDFLWHKLQQHDDDENDIQLDEDKRDKVSLQIIGASYIICLLLAEWALMMTYFVGPGYSKEIFTADKLSED